MYGLLRAVSPRAGWLHCFRSRSNSYMLTHPARGQAAAAEEDCETGLQATHCLYHCLRLALRRGNGFAVDDGSPVRPRAGGSHCVP